MQFKNNDGNNLIVEGSSMNKINSALIKMLSISTGCEKSIEIALNSSEWQQIYEEALAHQIHLLIFSEAYKQGNLVNPALFENWKNITIYHVLKSIDACSKIGDLLNDLEKANIPVIVLKGLHYKYLYSNPDLRPMGDIDLFTKREFINTASEIIQNYGYIKINKKNEPKHITFVHENYIPIELHFSLYTVEKRKVEINFNNVIWNSIERFSANGATFLVPSNFDQIIYCCIHMTNHFGKGGFGLRQLSDFNILIRKSIDSINWDELIKQAYTYGIGKFMEVMLYICNTYFNLDVPDYIIRKYISETNTISNMMEAIFDSGVFGTKNLTISSNRSLATYISNRKSSKFSKLRFLFPSSDNLRSTYSYAQKSKILLPVAWVHRIINNIFNKDLTLLEKIPDTKRINDYVELFRWLDIKIKF